MAVNSELIETIKASQLPKIPNPTTGDIIHAQGDDLSTTSLQFFIDKINNGYNGTMSNSLSVPTTGYYRYKVIDPGTYTNVTPSISVIEEEIKKNTVVISVRDGVATKELDPKIGEEPEKIFNPTNNINPSTMRATSDFVFDGAEFTNGYVGTKNIDAPSKLYRFSLPSHKSIIDSEILSITIPVNSAGTLILCLGKIKDDKFIEDEELGVYNVTNGLNDLIIKKYTQKNQIVAIKGGSAKIYFDDLAGETLYQYKENGTLNGKLIDAYYAFKINYKSSIKSNTINEVNSKYTLKNGENIGHATNEIPFGDLSQQTKYYLNKVTFDKQKFVKSIKMYGQRIGVINFAIGSIDQWGKFVERKVKTYNVIPDTYNVYYINEILNINEIIAIKCPITSGMTWENASGGQGLLWDSGNSYTGVLVNDTAHTISMEMDIHDYDENPLAFNEDLNNLTDRVAVLENKSIILTSPNGTPFKLSVRDDGTLITKSLVFGKIAHLGNSICRHQITSFWWGDWGMAATVREKDYVHRFLTKYQVKNPSATTEALNIAIWEQSPASYDKTLMDLTILDSDLIVIRIGENVTWSTSFKSEFRLLVEYIMSKVPNATLLIGGTFWYSQEKDNDMKAVADEKGITFVSMQGLDIPENKQTLSGQVFGDDGNWHTISDGGETAVGVANHPNDLGMDYIAQRLIDSLGIK
ncbi:hypothetical protein CMU70_14310 [Elizabethkingia anophelis]|nr:hypothetical protein [Elizabethkingia anophelis]